MHGQNFHPSIPDFCLNEWKLAEAIYDVPRLPGLYAIYSDCRLEECLYVGKSESSIRTCLASLAHKPWLMATSREAFRSFYTGLFNQPTIVNYASMSVWRLPSLDRFGTLAPLAGRMTKSLKRKDTSA